MIKFKHDDGEFTAPTDWDEVLVEHFIKPEFLSGNPIKLLSALSGIPEGKLLHTTEDVLPYFERTIGFMAKDPTGWMGEDEVPETIDVLGVSCTIPKELEVQSFGQKVMFGQALQKHTFVYAGIPEAVAVYVAPQIYPDNWHEKMDEVSKAVLKLPIKKVYRVAAFFLRTSKAVSSDGQTGSIVSRL